MALAACGSSDDAGDGDAGGAGGRAGADAGGGGANEDATVSGGEGGGGGTGSDAGSTAGTCSRDAGSWVSQSIGGGIFDFKQYGNYLTAVNAGWEVDIGTPFTNTAACLAMQAEPDCN